MPLQNPFGLGTFDLIELALAAFLVLLVILWPWFIGRAVAGFTRHTFWCALALSIVPVTLRLALLQTHPVPVAESAADFRNLLSADTLLHFRLSNPPHPLRQFFESDRSAHGIGNNWALVLLGLAALGPAAFSALGRWFTPASAFLFALLGTLLFGPLHPWANSYSGHYIPVAAVLILLGLLPRFPHRLAIPGSVLAIATGLCLASFGYRYTEALKHPARTTLHREIGNRLDAMSGKVLVFVRPMLPDTTAASAWPHDEADIDASRVVFARDLREPENSLLRKHFVGRKVLLLDLSARPPLLGDYDPTPHRFEREPDTPPHKDIVPGLRLSIF